MWEGDMALKHPTLVFGILIVFMAMHIDRPAYGTKVLPG
jgi:hypothetical protein